MAHAMRPTCFVQKPHDLGTLLAMFEKTDEECIAKREGTQILV